MQNPKAAKEEAMHLPYQQQLGARLSALALAPTLARLAPVIERYRTAPPAQAAAIFNPILTGSEIPRARALSTAWKAKFRTLVIIGAGGSGLSGKALTALSMNQQNHPHSLLVLDNLDAATFLPKLERLDLSATCFLVISKSGSTVETYAQTTTLIATLLSHGITDVKERMAFITIMDGNPLHALGERYGIPVLAHDADLGGRFSILSAVGLIPAHFMNVDIDALTRGAACSVQENLRAESPAAIGAATQHLMRKAGQNVTIFMVYSEQMFGLAQWWRQSCAESLGKGGTGSTPIIAIGTADQHSQLQLFLDGPDDKYFSLLLPRVAGTGPLMPALDGPLSYLSNHTLGDLVEAQQRGTAETLEKHKRPLRVFDVAEINAFTLGALLAHFTLEIIFMAELAGVNAFDQPAVEESKRMAHSYLTGNKS